MKPASADAKMIKAENHYPAKFLSEYWGMKSAWPSLILFNIALEGALKK